MPTRTSTTGRIGALIAAGSFLVAAAFLLGLPHEVPLPNNTSAYEFQLALIPAAALLVLAACLLLAATALGERGSRLVALCGYSLLGVGICFIPVLIFWLAGRAMSVS